VQYGPAGHTTRGPDTRASLRALQRAFRDAPAPELAAFVGLHEGEFVGPTWLRCAATLTLCLFGMPGWSGKAFRPRKTDADALEGENLVRRQGRLVPSIPVRARIAPSGVDGRPALVLSYPPDARFPWPRVRDELRPLDERTLLGLTFGVPLAPRGGAPFLLRHREG
jgi:hypothetical protein